MKTLRVFRSGLEVLKVSLQGKSLQVKGNPNLTKSLGTEGVLEPHSGRNIQVPQQLEGEEAPTIFAALYAHFQRASAYTIDLDET